MLNREKCFMLNGVKILIMNNLKEIMNDIFFGEFLMLRLFSPRKEILMFSKTTIRLVSKT